MEKKRIINRCWVLKGNLIVVGMALISMGVYCQESAIILKAGKVKFVKTKIGLTPSVKKLSFPDARNALGYVFPGSPYSQRSVSEGVNSYVLKENNLDFTDCMFSKTASQDEATDDDFKESMDRNLDKFYIDGNLNFTDCTVDRYWNLSNITITRTHSLNVQGVNANNLLIQGLNGNLEIADSYFSSYVGILQSKVHTFNFVNNTFARDTIVVRLGTTNFTDMFNFSFNDSTRNELSCVQDTLSGTVMLFSGEGSKASGSANVSFKKCYINALFKCEFSMKKSKLVFENCSFGPDANLSNLRFDTVAFVNCYNIPSPVALSFDKTKSSVAVSFTNSNITNLKFDYDDRLRLIFDRDANKDLKTNTFENLLAKFKTEGKFESEQNVDIIYQKYKYSLQGLNGRINNVIAASWWYYGYRKYYILYWTLSFVLLFFIINSLTWQKMQVMYPIMPEEETNRPQRNKKGFADSIAQYIRIFVFTSFIFFSLKIDFDKLNYKHTSYLVFFFVQYFVGLACVFFIVNAILKL